MENFHTLKLNINQIADLTGLHRQTVSSRLASLPTTEGSNSRLKLFLLGDLLRFGLDEKPSDNVDDLGPMERRAFWQAENERLKYEERTSELIPASEVALEMGLMAKAIIQCLETLPDILERDCGLPPKALNRVQSLVDDLRDQMALNIQKSSTDDQAETTETDEKPKKRKTTKKDK